MKMNSFQKDVSYSFQIGDFPGKTCKLCAELQEKKNKQAEIARGSSSPKQPLIRFDRKQVINVTL